MAGRRVRLFGVNGVGVMKALKNGEIFIIIFLFDSYLIFIRAAA